MGSGRAEAMEARARPPCREPVKATALVSGCPTISRLTRWSFPCRSEKVPEGISVFVEASLTISPSFSQVPGCPGCAFTMTGHPTARADMVSVPTTEIAKGKLQAPITTTGPRGMWLLCRAGFGTGIRSGSASSDRDSSQSSDRASPAKSRVSFTVRRSSIPRRGRPNEVSRWAREMISSELFSSLSAIVSRKFALRSPESFLKE